SENRTLLAQPALINHPALRIPANANLATARVVTGISTHGNVIPIFGFFLYFTQTDQTRARYTALINVATGHLMPPLERFSDSKTNLLQFDPDVTSFLPGWDAVLRHIKTAHQACA